MQLAHIFRVVSLWSDDSIVSGLAVKKDILPEVVVEESYSLCGRKVRSRQQWGKGFRETHSPQGQAPSNHPKMRAPLKVSTPSNNAIGFHTHQRMNQNAPGKAEPWCSNPLSEILSNNC